jgi:hypothetical protein
MKQMSPDAATSCAKAGSPHSASPRSPLLILAYLGRIVSHLLCLSLLLLGVTLSGCGKKELTPKTATATPAVKEQVDLAELSQLLRQYIALKKQTPKDLSELVSSGFINRLPAPPAGKKFVVVQMPFGAEVKLEDE